MVAIRVLFVVLAEALHCTEPDPIPVAPDEIDSQVASLLTAVHCKKGSSVKTDIVPLSLLWPALADDGLMLKAPPNCVTTSVAAEPCDGVTVIVAVRLVALGFPATE